MAAKTRTRRTRGLPEDYGPTTQTLLFNQRKAYELEIEKREARLFALAGELWRVRSQLRACRAGLNQEERDAIQAEEERAIPWHERDDDRR